jgi:hypothetical protein
MCRKNILGCWRWRSIETIWFERLNSFHLGFGKNMLWHILWVAIDCQNSCLGSVWSHHICSVRTKQTVPQLCINQKTTPSSVIEIIIAIYFRVDKGHGDTVLCDRVWWMREGHPRSVATIKANGFDQLIRNFSIGDSNRAHDRRRRHHPSHGQLQRQYPVPFAEAEWGISWNTAAG